ncbi:MAG: glycosyltransferase family 2 protein [Methanocalculus sp. MSAO_Arc2]|uniref:dolichyl-phosphate beta-glucosyltransferase n=1 Tax=Methanocalculus sp. MSAO_Arc2 TaxID=2293855 RepID=UPI000FF463F0|nr:MAG: glycosyltransferase family 2 protein [Methanocalculus sp. MSAO_Arc2]
MPGIREKDCSLIIPAYNEEERIGSLLDECLVFEGETIVVIEGDDRTREIVSEFIQKHPGQNIRYLSSSRRLGKGGGIRFGMEEASRPFIGFIDADGSTSIQEMIAIFQKLDYYDAVIGSRWLPDAIIPIRQGLWRRVQSRIFNGIIRIFFGLRYSDTQCGAKAFRREVIESVIDNLSATGFEFDVELLWKVEKAGFVIVEHPIQWSDRGGSTVRIRDSIAMLYGLLAIRFSQ